MEVAPDKLPDWVGKETGTSQWIVVDQSRIDGFADVTEDHQFIHVDPQKAAETEFGGTIAHGFLSLSLLAAMVEEGMLKVADVKLGLNYGFDKIRFLQPVRSGARIRGNFTLAEATEKAPGRWLLGYDVRVEIEGEENPALVARWLVMQVTGR